MAKMTPLEKDAMEKQVAAERKKGVSSGASDRVFKAGHEALSEMRRETRGMAPDVESREKAYKDPYTVDDANRDALQKDRAEKKGITIEQMRQNMSDEFDKSVKAGDFYKKGGTVSASKRADGIAQRGKTKGRYI